MNFRQLYHLVDDVHLSDKQYLLCLTIFYFSYALFEVCLFELWGAYQILSAF